MQAAMLRFKVFENGAPARSLNLDGAHLMGNDRVPLRAEISFANGELVCETRSRGAAALAAMWPVPGAGRVMLETARLMERPQPYNLHVELARGQLMRISQKREDWDLYDCPEGQPVYEGVDHARRLLVEALTAADDLAAARLAEESIAAGVLAGERIGIFRAASLLKRRQAPAGTPCRRLGCSLPLPQASDAGVQKLRGACDFAWLPFAWSTLQPAENKANTAPLEGALQLTRAHRLPVWGTAVLSFDEPLLPPWLKKAARDYDRFRDHVARHLRAVFKAFDGLVEAWEVITGAHACNPFRLNLDQLMELTRMAAMLARQASPRCPVLLGITLPWGEYYAHDPLTIPPLLYAELAIQHRVNFDAFSVQMQFGGQATAQYVRDMMQVSALLDRFGNLGKPVHITAAGVPSAGASPVSGYWHGEWSEAVQADWLGDFTRVALSKPFVETVSWQCLADGVPPSPAGGLLRADLSPKPAYERMIALGRELNGP
jgi:hypothetical protein